MSTTPRAALGPRAARAALGAVVAAALLALVGCTSSADHGDGDRDSDRDSASATPTAAPDRVTRETMRTAPTDLVFPGGLAVEPGSLASRAQAELDAAGQPGQADAAGVIAAQPVAMWIGDGYDDEQLVKVVTDFLDAADAQGATAVFVTYAIPDRDCGNYSAGGLTVDEYPAWNRTIAETIRGHDAVVIVEPDSLGILSRCPDLVEERLPLLRQAVEDFAAAGVPAYLDGGNSNWVDAQTMSERLLAAGVEDARGFFTNVSGFYRVDEERAYAERLSALTGDSHFVIDVSRNGRGWQGTWCNPDGAALGQDPHVAGGSGGLDALLWVKTPGISDGTCNGGPAAGTWWPSFAEGLVTRRVEDEGSQQ
ncbi:endoglucanase [Frigoribacterium sp. PvP120]|uniref:glycoside hydrolase family 6 protein n=1 Tax=unclassified Frigoribacterium TaxID=2627005 RepID=UPI001AE812C1|nr:glycoside hydrolase family 6 protein [Frigoribacterium sp. PvP121]MBP1240369.1 endoglucanase [Frigoribacterium sp. PvP121]